MQDDIQQIKDLVDWARFNVPPDTV